MLEFTFDTLSFVIGINIGITIGFWSSWYLFGRKKGQLPPVKTGGLRMAKRDKTVD